MRILQTLMAFSGNAPPQLAATRELVRGGHEVRVLAHRAARERVERTGAEFVAFERMHPDMDISRRETDTLRDWEAHTKLGAGFRLLRDGLFGPVRDTARDCAEELAEHPAELVILDWMLPGAAVAAEAAGIPAIVLVHCPYPLPSPGSPPLFSGLTPGRGPLGRERDRLLRGLTALTLRPGLPSLNMARGEQGLGPLSEWNRQLLDVEAICVMSAPELDFATRGELPTNVHYVGPAFEEFTESWVSPWPETNEDPLVVISFSTSYMDQTALAQRVLEAVGELPVRALLTAGPALATAGLRVPANARVEGFVAHRSVFPHASLVISHAGWQTVNAALADGVPLLCIPDGRDQPDNAARVKDVGAGIRAAKGTSPAKLRRLIARALEDEGLERGAAEMASALARSDGAAWLAENVERLAGRIPAR
jgi:UDP:flavonoid glycosyltransferase YjiC (YdhE family)